MRPVVPPGSPPNKRGPRPNPQINQPDDDEDESQDVVRGLGALSSNRPSKTEDLYPDDLSNGTDEDEDSSRNGHSLKRTTEDSNDSSSSAYSLASTATNMTAITKRTTATTATEYLDDDDCAPISMQQQKVTKKKLAREDSDAICAKKRSNRILVRTKSHVGGQRCRSETDYMDRLVSGKHKTSISRKNKPKEKPKKKKPIMKGNINVLKAIDPRLANSAALAKCNRVSMSRQSFIQGNKRAGLKKRNTSVGMGLKKRSQSMFKSGTSFRGGQGEVFCDDDTAREMRDMVSMFNGIFRGLKTLTVQTFRLGLMGLLLNVIQREVCYTWSSSHLCEPTTIDQCSLSTVEDDCYYKEKWKEDCQTRIENTLKAEICEEHCKEKCIGDDGHLEMKKAEDSEWTSTKDVRYTSWMEIEDASNPIKDTYTGLKSEEIEDASNPKRTSTIYKTTDETWYKWNSKCRFVPEVKYREEASVFITVTILRAFVTCSTAMLMWKTVWVHKYQLAYRKMNRLYMASDTVWSSITYYGPLLLELCILAVHEPPMVDIRMNVLQPSSYHQSTGVDITTPAWLWNWWGLLMFCRVYLVLRYVRGLYYSGGARIIGIWHDFNFSTSFMVRNLLHTNPLRSLVPVSLGAILLMSYWLYVAERTVDKGNIRTLWDAFWVLCVTFTTVGYGDRTPLTYIGRVVCMMGGVISVVLTAAITATALQKLSLMPYESRMVEFLEHATTANTLRKHAARIIQAAWRFRKKVKRNNELAANERDSIFLERRRLTDAISIFTHHSNTVQAYDRRYRNDQLVRSMLEDITRQCEEAKIYYSAASQIAAATGQALEIREQKEVRRRGDGGKGIVETEYKIVNARQKGELSRSSVLKKANSLAGKQMEDAPMQVVNQNLLERSAAAIYQRKSTAASNTRGRGGSSSSSGRGISALKEGGANDGKGKDDSRRSSKTAQEKEATRRLGEGADAVSIPQEAIKFQQSDAMEDATANQLGLIMERLDGIERKLDDDISQRASFLKLTGQARRS